MAGAIIHYSGLELIQTVHVIFLIGLKNDIFLIIILIKTQELLWFLFS